MRNSLKPAVGLLCLAALACAGCTTDTDESPTKAATTSPTATAPPTSASTSTTYAPYVNATEASELDAAGSAAAYNLAFVIAEDDGAVCTPAWNGTDAIDDAAVKSRISALTDTGASVRVSFGGASGTELARACDSSSELAEAYGAALDAAGSTAADFDVEGDALEDSDSVDLRSEAIALLQKDRPELSVSFTLPVMPSGLDDDGVALLDSANDHGVQVSTVNIMTMNYASSYDGDMGDYAERAAEATHEQLMDVFGTSESTAWGALALTSMLGVNDVDNETFTLEDAAQVREFAEGKGVAWVSMWATFRDRECGDGANDELVDCSGVDQEDGAFGEVFSG
ncbi:MULTISPECIES: chitinase [unclassified Streptomyces]|uniref:chitinase n=1 Tax=unclassified Streptomyces TaxID=2593676 RepID=UPI002E774345|nr:MULTISPECIES: chitinase [unclassified Streptomyces]MEE1759198.1 chitinase [Streptomyces sp. SP18BB07]MEE1830595.1 chitinase [Streptomyces sp. SP17KL33]